MALSHLISERFFCLFVCFFCSEWYQASQLNSTFSKKAASVGWGWAALSLGGITVACQPTEALCEICFYGKLFEAIIQVKFAELDSQEEPR